MTAKSDFTEEQWKTLLQGPPSAGLLVATAQRGGTFRESLSMAKAYVEARQRHGGSELLDEITAAKPEIDHTRAKGPTRLRWRVRPSLRTAEFFERFYDALDNGFPEGTTAEDFLAEFSNEFRLAPPSRG